MIKLYSEWDEETICRFLKNTAEKNQPSKKGVSNKCKWTDEEKAIRRWYILGKFREGLSKLKIQQILMEKVGIAYCTAVRYVNDALEYLVEDDEEDIDRLRGIARQRLEGLMESCLESGNVKGALGASEQLNKINGLYTERHEVKADTTISFEFGQ